MPARTMPGRRLLVLFVAAAGFRIGFIASRGDLTDATLTFPDEIGYWQAARSLARGDGLVDAFGYRATRMPAYPAFLSIFSPFTGAVGAARVAQAVLGALAAVTIGGLGANRFGRTVGLLAGLAVAVDPFLIFFSDLLLTETLFISALCAAWCVAWPLSEPGSPLGSPPREPVWRWILAGALFALCAYLRPSSVGLGPAFLFVVVLRRRGARPAVVGALAMIFMVLAALLPWAWRNRQVTGEWCWLTNRMGISLWDGLGPQADGSSNLAGTAETTTAMSLPEGAWNRYFRDEALRSARADVPRVLRLACVKVARTWNPFPNVGTYQSALVRGVSAGWTIPIYLLCLVGAWILRRSGWTLVLLILPASYFTVVHAVFVGSVRYRLPAMPLLELLAAVGLVALLRSRRSAGRHPREQAEGGSLRTLPDPPSDPRPDERR